MRLGIVMTGTGACAAANIGVLELLFSRGLDVYAVCGLNAGAWPAALYACGMDGEQMHKELTLAARAGKRLLCPDEKAKPVLAGKRPWLCSGERIARLLRLQTGEKLLALCSRKGIFPMRIASTGRHMVFSTCAYAQGRETILCQQATVGFAARAAMARPPFLSPLPWNGSWLLPESDMAWAARQMICMGADRVLIVNPQPALSRCMDALELAAASGGWAAQDAAGGETGLLTIRMPPGVGALDLGKLPEIAGIGHEAASAQLDTVLDQLGMAQCRILPFRMRAQQAVNPRGR